MISRSSRNFQLPTRGRFDQVFKVEEPLSINLDTQRPVLDKAELLLLLLVVCGVHFVFGAHPTKASFGAKLSTFFKRPKCQSLSHMRKKPDKKQQNCGQTTTKLVREPVERIAVLVVFGFGDR